MCVIRRDARGVITLTRAQVLLAVIPLVALLALAGSRIASPGTSRGPARAAPLAVVDEGALPPPRIVVHVVGAVRRSGLYRIRDGARVADAITRAGGPTAKADLAAVNLAAPVADGQQIVIPRRLPPGALPSAGDAGPGRQGQPLERDRGAARRASRDRAGDGGEDRRLARRARAAPLGDDLDAIPGIGPARVEQLRELVQP